MNIDMPLGKHSAGYGDYDCNSALESLENLFHKK